MVDLQKEINGISDIMTLPDVVAKITAMVRDPHTSAADITMVISNDIALSAKVLRLVNSPFYGFNRRITSINYAIVILGFNAIRNLALSAFMYDMYRSRVEGFNTRDFWRFSISCAAGAQTIAARLGFTRCDDAFMGGLLHDIGIVVMTQHLQADFNKVLQHNQKVDVTLLEAEQAVLDYDHREVGGLLMDRWNLPSEMAAVCRNYVDLPDGSDKICALIHLSHVLCCALCLGNPGDHRIPALSPLALPLLGMEEDQLPEMAELVLQAGMGISAFLELDAE